MFTTTCRSNITKEPHKEPPALVDEPSILLEEDAFFDAIDPLSLSDTKQVKTYVSSYVKSLLSDESEDTDVMAAIVDQLGMVSLLDPPQHEKNPLSLAGLFEIHKMRQSGRTGEQDVYVDGKIVKRSVEINHYYHDDNYPFNFYKMLNKDGDIPKAILLPGYDGDKCFLKTMIRKLVDGGDFNMYLVTKAMKDITKLGNFSAPKMQARVFHSTKGNPPKNPKLRNAMLGSAAALRQLMEDGTLPESKLSLWKPKPDSDTQYNAVEEVAPALFVFDQDASSLVRGIHNFGATCYQNSVLQLLFTNPTFWMSLGNSGSAVG